MITGNCSACKYWNKTHGDVGDCRKNAPHVIAVPTQNPLTREQGLQALSLFPPMKLSEWCGEFEPDFNS